MTVRTALVGYGSGGRYFHAPFLAADPDLSLDVIVTSDPGRAASATAEHPGARVVPDLATALAEHAGELDLVVVSTPPERHAEQVAAALEAGLHVVVDKPMTVRAEEAAALVALAEERGLVLTVFQNRRWDGDFRTLRRLVDGGALGTVRRFESRFETWKPVEAKAWKQAGADTGAGVLYDLGVHLVDQAVQLLGPVADASAELVRHRPGEGADDDSLVVLHHVGGAVSHLRMSTLTPLPGPRFQVVGSEGGFLSWGLDSQEAALKDGARPDDPGFGERHDEGAAVAGVAGQERPVTLEPGRYADFYRGVVRAVLEGAPPPVDPRDAVAVVELVERLHRDFPVRRGPA
ncbi:Gfo/Idh/MocA family oxidoreductase [Ornithinimicrobium humiphilum]|uniref:Putative dehydrogenase n=1 Tax=Ornithinimicrobium humiphilum TaxID=125288 RepID=A0A543KLF0_9MICO|nr:Gfo/Idh/MocA family oxidoreductase [Ornithinimicrobium humiphilum]TQM95860.1 putative dehydrogenase [Ornithinimicrobium humiphilum]